MVILKGSARFGLYWILIILNLKGRVVFIIMRGMWMTPDCTIGWITRLETLLENIKRQYEIWRFNYAPLTLGF